MYPSSMEDIGIVSVSNLLSTSKYVCACSKFWMVCSVGAVFILIRTEHPYIQSSVARATGTFAVQC
jgi:hypothetical protein